MSNSAYRRCCGMDVHKKSVTVHVLPPDGSRGADKSRIFRTFTRDLHQMRLWLEQCKVSEVVMESTGQYWRPIWNVLEGSIEKLVLMNPQHVRGLKGRKTDPADAKWLAGHLARGELIGSFVPPPEVRQLRDLTRLRVRVLQDINRVKNRIGQLCETGNVKISSVASDLFGLSARRMLRGLVDGQRDAAWMADWARGTLRNKRGDLRLALEGHFSPHQRQLLSQMLEQLAELESHVDDLTQTVNTRMAPHEEAIRRLMTIPGVDRLVAWTVMAEIGFDMTVFADSKHLASWAGLCPGNHESGGKRRSGRMRKGNWALRRVLCQAAWAASRTKGSFFENLYHRYRGRMGHSKAIMALAHRLLVVIYHVMATQIPYCELGADYWDQKQRGQVARKMVDRLARLGFKVTLEDPTAVPVEAPPPDNAGQPPVEHAPVKRRGRPCKCEERGIPCHHARRVGLPPTENSPPPITQPIEVQIP